MSYENGGDTVVVIKQAHFQTVETSVMSTSNDSIMPYDAELHCERGDLLGPLGLFVQGLLAFIAFASLIGKDQVSELHKISFQ